MSNDWMEVRCPICGSSYNHFLGNIETRYFENEFKQGCLAAISVYCEANPKHLYFVLVGEHKGVIAVTTVIPPHEPETMQ